MARERTEWVNVRLTANETDMLKALMDEEGATASALIRGLIQAAHADVARRRAIRRATKARPGVRIRKGAA